MYFLKMLIRFWLNIVYLMVLVPFLTNGQHFRLAEGKKAEKVRFQLVNNLMVIPVEVNGTELHFLLDSGVSQPILFNISAEDSLQINNVTEMTIRGVGNGDPIQALSSSGNTFKINNVTNSDQRLYVVMDKGINLSPALGVTIHGIMGYELFRDFVVDISYAKRIVKFHAREHYKDKVDKAEAILPLVVRRKKAYLEASVFLEEKKGIPVNLLVDTGSSDAVWLFENDSILVPDKNYEVFLGTGLNGSVYGKRTKITGIALGDFYIENAKAAFPDNESYGAISNFGMRNGSLGGEILKRFDVVFDYANKTIKLKKNKLFKAPFHYNLSGLDVQHNGMRYIAERIADSRGFVRGEVKSFGDVQLLFESKAKISLVPEIVISAIRNGSPAYDAGLREGDIILAVNGKSVHRYKLQHVIHLLNEKEGKKIKLRIGRYNSDLMFTFVLRNMLK